MSVGQVHFGVYGLILSADECDVLVVRKTRGPYTDWYDLPGGRLDAGETESQALAREILEETGTCIVEEEATWHAFDITLKQDSLGGPIDFRHTGKWKRISVTGVDAGAREADDVSAAVWCSVRTLLQSRCISAPLEHVLKTLGM